jgi:hypothetical protein
MVDPQRVFAIFPEHEEPVRPHFQLLGAARMRHAHLKHQSRAREFAPVIKV